MRKLLLLFSIFVLALFVRFYNFENRITFGSEQARSLIVSANYIKEKPSLLGQEYFRTNSEGHKLFASSLFNYSLVPLLLVSRYNPILITLFFALLNVLTGFILYVLLKKIVSEEIAIFGLILFLFNSYMIYHSMFIWILNYLPLIGIVTFYLTFKIIKRKNNTLDILFLGILSGIGFGMEYLYALLVIVVLFVLIKFLTKKVKGLFIFFLGGMIGDLPQILFDLRHNFYHLKTLWQYSLDTFSGKSDAGFVYYHFLGFWPVFIIIGSFILFFVYKKNRYLSYLLVLIYLIFNLSSSLVNFNSPTGMPGKLTINDILAVSKTISEKATNDFNVVTLYDFDTRGYTLRYFTKYVFNKNPMGEIEYPTSKEIFALAKSHYDFNNNNPWELNVFKPYNIDKLANIGEGFSLFKLTRKN